MAPAGTRRLWEAPEGAANISEQFGFAAHGFLTSQASKQHPKPQQGSCRKATALHVKPRP